MVLYRVSNDNTGSGANNMAESTAIDWSKITGKNVERLRASKVTPVPAHIVKLAQASFDQGTNMEFDFSNLIKDAEQAVATAAEFAKHMRNAGNHTTPATSVSVVVGPEDLNEAGDRVKLADHVVRWKAGKRRGKAAA
jgi:hypothetical protein